MPRYELRYFFDPGSGICLWSANDEARDRFGYDVEFEALELSENLRRKGLYLLRWYDTSIDWSNPAGPSTWPAEERARFSDAARDFLGKLREFLGGEFEIKDEVKS